LSRPSGTIVEEVVHPLGAPPTGGRPLTTPLVRAGEVLAAPDLNAARELAARGLGSLPWEGLALSRGEPAIPTRQAVAR
jgi:nicotinate phosphoribosyltransferase